MNVNKKLLMEMLQYKRPEGTVTQSIFCEKYLEPIFGEPDNHGNYIHIIYNDDGSDPNLCFTAHHDTVHRTEGHQKVIYDACLDVVYTEGSNCLGADCTTGIWLILGMIEGNIPGVYVVHAAEEVGCKGSRALVKEYPDWLKHIDAVISFDRRGVDSIVTHQMGARTASTDFALSLASVLDIEGMKPDSTGVYTDSNEYTEVVSECTNISVGYYNQHTSEEYQDVEFAEYLLSSLVNADWSKLTFHRDITEIDYDRFYSTEPQTVAEVIYEYPDEVAEMLELWGYTADSLLEDIGYKNKNRYIG